MIRLQNKTNTNPPNSKYIYGYIQDENPPNDPGTPVDHAVYNDLHQTQERLLDWIGFASNGKLDNADNGFQLFEAWALLAEKENIKQHGVNVQETAFGGSDLTSPRGIFVDHDNAHLYVMENESSNKRVFIYDINTLNRITSLEFNLSNNFDLGGLFIKDQIAYIPHYNSDTDEVNLIVYDVQAGSSLGVYTLWNSSNTVGSNFQPDCDAIDNILYVTKGDAADTGQSGSQPTEIKALDITDPSNLTDLGVVASGPTNDAYTTIEVVEKEESFYASLLRGSAIELYDIGSGYVTPEKVNTLVSFDNYFHVVGGNFLFQDTISGNPTLGESFRTVDQKSQVKGKLYAQSSGTFTYIKSFFYPTKDSSGRKNYKVFAVEEASGFIVLFTRQLNSDV